VTGQANYIYFQISSACLRGKDRFVELKELVFVEVEMEEQEKDDEVQGAHARVKQEEKKEQEKDDEVQGAHAIGLESFVSRAWDGPSRDQHDGDGE